MYVENYKSTTELFTNSKIYYLHDIECVKLASNRPNVFFPEVNILKITQKRWIHITYKANEHLLHTIPFVDFTIKKQPSQN